MLLLLLDADRDYAAHLTAMLEHRGHRVVHAIDEASPPDAVIIGLPGTPRIGSKELHETPILLLVEGFVPFDEIESWIEGRTRWALLSKPVRESSLELSLGRITRGIAPGRDARR